MGIICHPSTRGAEDRAGSRAPTRKGFTKPHSDRLARQQCGREPVVPNSQRGNSHVPGAGDLREEHRPGRVGFWSKRHPSRLDKPQCDRAARGQTGGKVAVPHSKGGDIYAPGAGGLGQQRSPGRFNLRSERHPGMGCTHHGWVVVVARVDPDVVSIVCLNFRTAALHGARKMDR